MEYLLFRLANYSLPISPGPELTGDIGVWKVSSLVQEMTHKKINKFKSVVKCVLLPTTDMGVSVAMPMLHDV